MDKTGFPEISKIWPDSTCVISAWRKGQILLVSGNPVLSTTRTTLSGHVPVLNEAIKLKSLGKKTQHIVKRKTGTVYTKFWPQEVQWGKLARKVALPRNRTDQKNASKNWLLPNSG